MQRLNTARSAKLVPVLLCLIVLLMTACGSTGNSTGSSTNTKAPANKQVFVSVYQIGAGDTDIKTFDPTQAADQPSITAIEDVFTGLVTLNDNSQIQGQLASSWDVSSDKMTYTFHLKPNLKFSDGTPLTSADVAYSINRALEKNTASSTAPYYLRYIKDAAEVNSGKIKTLIGDSLIATDPSTLKIIISSPIPFFLDTLTYPCSFVVEQSLINKYGNTQWTNHLNEGGGDGPFKVKAWKHSQEIDLVPNTYYYDKKPQLQEIVYPFYKDADSTRADYLAGRIDDATIPLADYASDSTRPDFFKYLVATTWFYTMNYNQKPFDNIKIRQAFELSINKSLIASKIWHGSYVATNHIVPQGVPGYDANLKGPDGTTSTSGNPTLAKQLLQEGMKEEGISTLPPIKLTYASNGVQAERDEVTEMQQEWKSSLGVNVDTEDVEYNTLIGDVTQGAANPLQFYYGPGWIEDYPDLSDWLTLQFDAGSSQNNMNYGQNKSAAAAEQQAVQKELEKADVSQDPAQRTALYNDAEQKLVTDVAWMPMEQSNNFGLRKPCVKGVPPNIQGLTPPDDWANIYITTNSQCANRSVS